jgi:cytochrome P450
MVRAPAVGPIAFVRGVRSRGFLHFAGDLWREHGDVFEAHVGHRRLVFVMHPDAVEQVTVSGRQLYDKRDSYDGARKYLIGQGLVGSTGDLWRRQRKLMAPFFTPRGVATYANLVVSESLRFAARWEHLADEEREVDLSEEMSLITASIILKAMFSSETPESITQMKSAVETMIAYVDTQNLPVRLPTWLPSRRNHRYFKARHLVHSSIAALIAERRAVPEADWPNDLLSRLMEARDPDTGDAMTETLLRDESITIFFAGHETTARTITAAWYALETYPEVAAWLHQELDSVLGDREPTLEELHHLPYTLQVVKEVLRLYPPAPFYARDAIGDDQIGGFDVPSGATIMLSPFYTHRHPDFWTDPDRFDPDRWTRDAETTRHGHSYHPFAAGPRICIGNNFSLLESHLLLAVLARRFRPRLRDGFVPHFVMHGTLSIEGGLPAVIETR